MVRRGRMVKAEQFSDAASTVSELAVEAADVGDAYVTLCVHAGIAASDVICAARLGRYSRGENDVEAVRLLGLADADIAKHLQTLLGMKTVAGYSHMPVSGERVRRAARAMDALMEAARAIR